MPKITADDKKDFAGFCKQATDEQIVNIYEHEKKNRRRTYAQIAKEEAIRRGLL